MHILVVVDSNFRFFMGGGDTGASASLLGDWLGAMISLIPREQYAALAVLYGVDVVHVELATATPTATALAALQPNLVDTLPLPYLHERSITAKQAFQMINFVELH